MCHHDERYHAGCGHQCPRRSWGHLHAHVVLDRVADRGDAGAVTLQNGRDNVSVHCTKECYQDGAGVIASNMEGMTAGNIILGGVIGIGVDAASGAMNSYTPDIQVIMTPIPGCRPAGAAPPSARR